MSWMNIYRVIHYFVEGNKNGHFHLRFRAKLQGGKMTSERWQHHNVTFTQRSVGLLVKSVHFSNLCCIMYQWWPLQIGERALFKFFSKVCRPVTQKVKRISECLFRYWVLTSFNFGIFIFKAIYGSVPEIIAIANFLHFFYSLSYLVKRTVIKVLRHIFWILFHSQSFSFSCCCTQQTVN